MKKIILTLLILITVIAMTNCGGSEGGNGDTGPFTVTFDKNNNDADGTEPEPKTAISNPSTGKVDLPFEPERSGYTFRGWNTKSNGSGEAFTSNTIVTANITVYAKWIKFGDPDLMEDGTIYVKYPKFTVSGGVTYNAADYVYRLSGAEGNMDYVFPTNVGSTHASALNYDYFIVLISMPSGESGATTGIRLRQYNSTTAYGGNYQTNKMPWLSNADGKNILLEVSGRGSTNGFRIYVPTDTAVERLQVDSITFYKAPRYTVTFDPNYSGASAITVPNVWGKDDNHPGYGVGTAWPSSPVNPPKFFLGWYKNNDLYTADTIITEDVTLTAKWSDTEPVGWMEKISNTSTCAPLYGFSISSGTLGDYDRVTFKLKADGDTLSGRLRAWGAFPTSIYAESNFPLSTTGIQSIYNAAAGLLLTNTNGASTPSGVTDGMTLASEDGWREYTLDLKGGRDAAYGTASGLPGKWEDTATGVILLAIGIVPGAGQSGVISYFIKDIALKNGGGQSVEALKPNDSALWNGKGASAFVQQSGSGPTTRQIMFPD
ncbi:InlB B-repeat-containing protein [Treponema sp. R80B11-R83G3]